MPVAYGVCGDCRRRCGVLHTNWRDVCGGVGVSCDGKILTTLDCTFPRLG
jgi:hypothetical protein